MPTETKDCPFCFEKIKAKAKKCRYCHEFMDGYDRVKVLHEISSGDTIGGDKIVTGDTKDSSGIAVGKDIQQAQTGDIGGSLIQADGDVILGKDRRDEQYRIASNWDGKERLREFDLSKRDLSSIELANADLRSCNLNEANLSRANLSGANLSGANLIDADLSGANLSGTNLSKAILSGTNLSKAILIGADLIGAELRDAILLKAYLSRANLSKANLSGANLSGTNLNKVILSGATHDHATTWPKNFDPIAVEAILVED